MPPKAHLLLIDDDPNTLASLSRAFRLAGHEATVCDNANRAVEILQSQRFDLILSDVVMPGKTGMELLEELRKSGLQTPIVLISGQANIEMAVKATRLGALDFLEKPLTTDKLLLTVDNALKLSRLEDENRELRTRLGKHELVGSGAAMTKLQAQIDRVAASETRVCILGETGTGKELVARAIHEKSPRHENSFITLNCAAVPAELIESELFGHEKGSFTGAASRHTGKFEQAEGGTLFLDEIGDMPLAMQAKLLRVLEEGEVERVGGDKPIKVNVRVIVATHRNLEDLVRKMSFVPTCSTASSFSLLCPRFASVKKISPHSSRTSPARSPSKMAGGKNSFPKMPSPNSAAIAGQGMSANSATSLSVWSYSQPKTLLATMTSAEPSRPPN